MRFCGLRACSRDCSLLGTASRWYGYLKSLPSEGEWDGIGLFWYGTGDVHTHYEPATLATLDEGQVEDLHTARRWLRGTRVQEYVVDERGGLLLVSGPCSLSFPIFSVHVHGVHARTSAFVADSSAMG